MDAVEQCCKVVDRYDPELGTSPLAYFTQVCYFKFLDTIKGYKKQMYVVYKKMENDLIMHGGSNVDESYGSFGSTNMDESSHDSMYGFIEYYEDRVVGKKSPKPKTETSNSICDLL